MERRSYLVGKLRYEYALLVAAILDSSLPCQFNDNVLCAIVTGDPENMKFAVETAFLAGR